MSACCVKFQCGHTDVVEVYGDSLKKQYVERLLGRRLCPECKLKQEMEEAEKNASALPPLKGSPAQVEWAMRLREASLKALEASFEFEMVHKTDDIEWLRKALVNPKYEDEKTEYEKAEKEATAELEKLRELKKSAFQILRSKTSASYWIDNREWRQAVPYAARVVKQEQERLAKLEAKAEEITDYVLSTEMDRRQTKAVLVPGGKAENGEELPPQERPILIPEGSGNEVLCEMFKTENGNLGVRFDYNEDVRAVLKAGGFMWEDEKRFWWLPIGGYYGSFEDRAAETGHRLLKAGFGVTEYDEEIRRRIIQADYEPMQWKKVLALKDGSLGIRWGWTMDYYDKARKIRSAKWEKPYMTVQVKNWREVKDFAAVHGFTVTEAAEKLIRDYEEELAGKTQTVSVGEVKKADESGHGVTAPDIEAVAARLTVDD